MNRHGISQNPTEEEADLLRVYQKADRLISENARLIQERDLLRAELARLRSASREAT